MVFSSSIFLLYFLPIFFVLYAISPKKFKNYLILFGSILYYSWGAPRFVFVVIGSTWLNYVLINRMHRSKRLNACDSTLYVRDWRLTNFAEWDIPKKNNKAFIGRSKQSIQSLKDIKPRWHKIWKYILPVSKNIVLPFACLSPFETKERI